MFSINNMLEFKLATTKNIVYLADSVKMRINAMNKISCSLKTKHFTMPNTPYSNRCGAFKESSLQAIETMNADMTKNWNSYLFLCSN